MITESRQRTRAPLPPNCVWLDPTRVRELEPGTHLVTPRRSYTHHGIYCGAERVVHYAGLCRHRIRGPIEEVAVADFSHGGPLAYVPRPLARYQGRAVVVRARSRIGEDAYDLLTNNCEHFCNWCLDGRAYSDQVDAFMQLPGRLVEKMLARIARA